MVVTLEYRPCALRKGSGRPRRGRQDQGQQSDVAGPKGHSHPSMHGASCSFAPWGFQRLEIDRAALAGGSFALSAAAGIFPDGLSFEMPLSAPAAFLR